MANVQSTLTLPPWSAQSQPGMTMLIGLTPNVNFQVLGDGELNWSRRFEIEGMEDRLHPFIDVLSKYSRQQIEARTNSSRITNSLYAGAACTPMDLLTHW